MQVYGSSYVHGTQAVNAPHATRATGATAPLGTKSVTDQLDISSAGQFVDQVAQLPDIRQDRVSQLRAAIASGNYETDDKMSTALNRLLDEIA